MARKRKPPETVLPHPLSFGQITEVWVLVNRIGTLVPPLDDDGTDSFLAFPTKEQAMIGLRHQMDMYADADINGEYLSDNDFAPRVARLFPPEIAKQLF